MTGKCEDTEVLIERFFEGQTSNAEEQYLYDFFAGADIPAHLLPYKPVFAYFDAGLQAECEGQTAPVHRISDKKKSAYTKWMLLGTAAAAVLLAFLLLNLFSIGEKSFDPYEGSFIIRNGVRITDPEVIRPELEATIQYVMQQQEEAKQLVAKTKEAEQQFISVEEQIRSQYNAILEGFQDEYVRKEVERIFNIEY